ncbi:hypothetical protein OS42_02510 [Dickeya oryzae]
MNAHTPSFNEENPSVPSSIPVTPFSREEWVSIGMCLRDFFCVSGIWLTVFGLYPPEHPLSEPGEATR